RDHAGRGAGGAAGGGGGGAAAAELPDGADAGADGAGAGLRQVGRAQPGARGPGGADGGGGGDGEGAPGGDRLDSRPGGLAVLRKPQAPARGQAVPALASFLHEGW